MFIRPLDEQKRSMDIHKCPFVHWTNRNVQWTFKCPLDKLQRYWHVALIVPIVAFSEFSWIDREQPSRTVVFLKCEAYNRSFSSFPLSKTCFISLQANSVVQRKMANITIIK